MAAEGGLELAQLLAQLPHFSFESGKALIPRVTAWTIRYAHTTMLHGQAVGSCAALAIRDERLR